MTKVGDMSKNKNKVGFGRMESISGLWDDDGSQEIVFQDRIIGEIVRHMVDTSRVISEVRVGSYTVEFFDLPNTSEEDLDKDTREFSVRDYPNTRTCHTAVKGYVRALVAERIKKNVLTPLTPPGA